MPELKPRRKYKNTVSFFLILSLALNLISFSVSASKQKINDVDIYRNNENDYKKIALTFDDGPHPRYTPMILDILEEYGIKATFFVIGVNVDNYHEPLEKIINSGNEIGNHTYSHPHISRLNLENLKDEVERCESAIYGLTDYKTKLFRPPEGMVDTGVKNVLSGLYYKVILWDIDTRDWAHTSPEKIAENVINNVKSGDIILMHDYISYNSPTPEALRIFIPELLNKGYKFVVVSELIGLN